MKIHTLQPTESLPPFITLGDCKKGETSAKTGCTPSSGGGGKKPTDAEIDEFEKDLDRRKEEMDKGGSGEGGGPWDDTDVSADFPEIMVKDVQGDLQNEGKGVAHLIEQYDDEISDLMLQINALEETDSLDIDKLDNLENRLEYMEDKKEIAEKITEELAYPSENTETGEEAEESPDAPDYHRIDPDVMGDVAWRHRDTLSRVASAVEKGNDFDTESIGNLIKDLQGLQDQAKGGFKKSREAARSRAPEMTPEDEEIMEAYRAEKEKERYRDRHGTRKR